MGAARRGIKSCARHRAGRIQDLPDSSVWGPTCSHRPCREAE